jgi:hypothetical protein
MHGRRLPSFFFTKKKLEEPGDVEGRMYPCPSDSATYVSIATVSSWNNGYR